MRRAHRIATIAVLGTIGTLAGVTAATAGGGGHCAPDEARGNRVELEGACFTPSTLHAEAGETITFVNRDPLAHNVSGTGWGNYEDMGTGDRFTTSFLDDGIYPFACTLHPGMNGAIVVGDAEGGAAAADVTALTSTPRGPGGGEGAGWIVAGSIGLLIGSAVGAGLTSAVRRGRVDRARTEGVPTA
jgi:plastocyanin